MTDDKQFTIIDDDTQPVSDEQRAALHEFVEAHLGLGAEAFSFQIQPLNLDPLWAAIEAIGNWANETLSPLIDVIAEIGAQIDAFYLRDYGMTMSDFMALQEYFKAQQWDVDWEEE